MTGPLAAQQLATPVTETQVAEYKRAASAACQDAGKKRGDPEAHVEAFCGCMMQTLEKTMTAAEWRQVVLYSLKKQEREEAQALRPHLEKIAACRQQ